ncbi:hypothetical protein G5714_007955 [Onychostoma macrolepis]|uniref:Uncharacterized protein n=1 Tax=Onychostoma macrolepis TaxID=369639 RepID=A0A7J6CV65_9TELE|nr:hypothetical protein G5714_007955 [Onychostoma macrolepis]
MTNAPLDDQKPSAASGLVLFDASEEDVIIKDVTADDSMSLAASDAEEWGNSGVSPIVLLYVADSAVPFDELVNGIETSGMKDPRIVQAAFNKRGASIERLWGPCRATCCA